MRESLPVFALLAIKGAVTTANSVASMTIFMSLVASNLLAFSIKSVVPWSIMRQGISRTPALDPWSIFCLDLSPHNILFLCFLSTMNKLNLFSLAGDLQYSHPW